MARPRKKSNKDLPANLYRGEGDSWRYRHPVTGKFHGMGTDKHKACVAARKLNDMLIPQNDLVTNVLGNSTFEEFKTWYLENIKKKNGKPLTKGTKISYTSYLDRCSVEWGHLRLDAITLRMVNEFLDTLPITSSNACRSVLKKFFATAISKGLCTDNLADKVLIKPTRKIRKRHTLEGLTRIRTASPIWLQNAIDIAMLTTQRRIDILNMQWTDIQDGYLHVAQEKTTEESDDEFEELTGSGYVRIKVDHNLQTVFERCKSKINSPFIVNKMVTGRGRKRTDGLHWSKVTPKLLSDTFRSVAEKVNAYPNYTKEQLPTFHEIRALAIFLHKKAGKSAQALAGHSTPQMTERYEAGHEIIWNDVDVGISLPFEG